MQWTAQLWGWVKNKRFPNGLNVTGAWHYDYLNNRVRQDFLGHATHGPSRFLKSNTTLYWFGEPGERHNCTGCEVGHFYAVVRPPVPGLVICSKISYPGLGIVRPDAFELLRLQDPKNMHYEGREHADGRWADHWRYFFMHNGNQSDPCNGNFTLWSDIYDGTPVKDFGPNDCDGGMASSHWHDFVMGAPDPTLWTVQDFSKCKPTSPDELMSDSAHHDLGLSIASFGIRGLMGHHGRLNSAASLVAMMH